MPKFAAVLCIVSMIAVAVFIAGVTAPAVLVGAAIAAGGIGFGVKYWASAEMPKSVAGWLGMVVLCLAVGGVVYAVECAIGRLMHPETAFLEAGFRTGPFGGICTVVVTGWLALFCIGGAAYRATEEWMRMEAKGSR